MKYLFLILLSSAPIFANVEYDLKHYLFDDCKASNTQNNPLFNTCADQTVSFHQPASDGPRGYEGKCGQTAASNLMYEYCNETIKPSSLDQLLRDITPGVMPKTLGQGLNSLFKKYENCPTGNWQIETYKNKENYLLALKSNLEKNSKSFLPALIYLKNNVLHWVTVVELLDYDSTQCLVVVNSWGKQYQVPCDVFASMANDVVRVTAGSIGKYILIEFKTEPSK